MPYSRKEETMHIHGVNANNYAANLQSPANDVRAIAAQRAAEARKRLLKSGQNVEAELSPDQVLMVRHWLGNRSGQGKNDDRDSAGS
ncbi:MAG: hypothetical protein ACLPH3_17050 [Terracidiphilus sp.]